MPTQQRLRPDDFEGIQHPRSQAIEPNKQQPVDAAEGHPLRAATPQHVELMPKH
jgi:hypothetical protein